MNKSFYEFTAKNLAGKEVSMSEYENKLILIVNTASKCGLTPQYAELEALYKKYKAQNFVILGFPCNQFGNQEPGDEKSISEGCLLNYGVSFPMFSKINVNGPDANPLYVFLKKSTKSLLGTEIKWNFTKFLVDKSGKPIKRFAPVTHADKIEKYIQKLL